MLRPDRTGNAGEAVAPLDQAQAEKVVEGGGMGVERRVGHAPPLPRRGAAKSERRLDTIPGSLPLIGTPLPACVFEDRCTLATEEDGRLVDVKALVEPGDALEHAWDRQYRQFREAVERGVAPHASAADGVALQRIVDGIYRSSAEGREIEL